MMNLRTFQIHFEKKAAGTPDKKTKKMKYTKWNIYIYIQKLADPITAEVEYNIYIQKQRNIFFIHSFIPYEKKKVRIGV